MAGWPGLLDLCLSSDGSNKTIRSRRLRRYSAAFAPPAAKPILRYMPTYRLESKTPLNTEVCEKIIKEVMKRAFKNFIYKPKQSLIYSAQVSEEIKNRIKEKNYDRYRYVCVVTIGEKLMQGFNCQVNFLWDAEKDGYLSYVYETPLFFALASFFYLYYD